MTTPLAIRIAGVVKRFGAVEANRDASLEVRAGEIHALVGENGAGKSTLMRVLAGMYAPDGGTVEVNGRDVTGWTTKEAIAAGVGMVHQHFMLVPTLTVAENVVLGREPGSKWRLDREAAREAVRKLVAQTGLVVDPDRTVAQLSVGEAQRVEILKTLYRGARVLVLDEPTAVLSPPEVTELWAVLRRLRADGGTIVLITHKLGEVMEVSDAITVMRGGRTVGHLTTASTSPAEIARAMVGRDVVLAADLAAGAAPPVTQRAPMDGDRRDVPEGAAALDVRDLVVRGPRKERACDGVSFHVNPGEILGIAGVEGNGQTELIEALAGLRPVSSGSVHIGQRDVTRYTVRERADAGLSHIPEDRHLRGLVLEYTVGENLILGLQHRFTAGGGALDRSLIATNAERQIQTFDIRPPSPDLPARALSGGNQQKIVVAREMGRDFQVLLASQPTRGVDVGAIEFIHDQLRRAREARRAILLVSADLTEIIALSDRVAVMYDGRIVAVLPRGEATAEAIGPYMTGAHAKRGATDDERGSAA